MDKRCKKRSAQPQTVNQSELDLFIYQTPSYHQKDIIQKQLYSEPESSEEFQANEENEIAGDMTPRKQNSLSLLTKTFIKLIKSKQNFIIDITQVTELLGVQKRRVYDITNVLEGIGYIRKIQRNKLQWVGASKDCEVGKKVLQLDQKIQQLCYKHKEIDEDIRQIATKLKKEASKNKQLNFFLERDLREILENAEGNPGSMLVIKAMEGAVIQIQDNKLTVQKGEQEGEMQYTTVTKKDRDHCFEISR